MSSTLDGIVRGCAHVLTITCSVLAVVRVYLR